MVEKLKDKISSKGLKHQFLARKLGITRSTFSRKLNSSLKFTSAEMYLLSDLLNLSELEKESIFFTEQVANK